MSRTQGARTARGALLAASLLALPLKAHAGNTDSFYFSDDAALTAGAVTATADGAGAMWYNPAGLAINDRDQLKLNGSGFALRIRPVPSALATTYPGTTQSSQMGLTSVDFFSTPNAIAIVRNLRPGLSVGLGIFVTQIDSRSASSQTDFDGQSDDVTPAVPSHFQQRLDLTETALLYHAGPSIGWQALPTLRLGASLFATYGKGSFSWQYLVDAQETGANGQTLDADLYTSQEKYSYFGMQAQVGAQWDPGANWHFGLLVRSPEFVLSSSYDDTEVQAYGYGMSPITFQLDRSTSAPYPGLSVVNAARVIASAALDVTPEARVSAEVDYQPGVDNSATQLAPVLNARVGIRYQASEKMALGAGLFTDRTNVPASLPHVEFLEDRVNYYGATLGVEFQSPLSLTDSSKPKGLVFTSTFAVRYAVGFGQAGTLQNNENNANNLTVGTASVVYQEIVPYLGAGLLF